MIFYPKIGLLTIIENRMINDASIYSTIVVLLAVLPRLLFFIFSSKRRLPVELFRGVYLVMFVLMILSFLSVIPLTLLFSVEYGVIAKFFGWILFSHTALGLILVLWIIFMMHGYELRYQFKKIVVPAPLSILESFVLWLTAILSSNYWALIPCIVFTISSCIWNYKGYKLTLPPIDDDVPLREDDEY